MKRIITLFCILTLLATFSANAVRVQVNDVPAIVSTLAATGAVSFEAAFTINAADPSVIFDTTTATDTDFWIGVQEDASGDDNDTLQIGKGTVKGTTPFFTWDKDGGFIVQNLTDAVTGYQWLDADGGTPILNIDTTNERVGINATGPDRKLDVLDASNPQLRLTRTDGTVYTDFQTDSYGDLTITPSGEDIILGSQGWIYTTGSNILYLGGRGKQSSIGLAAGITVESVGGVVIEQDAAGDYLKTGLGSNAQLTLRANLDQDDVLIERDVDGDSSTYSEAGSLLRLERDITNVSAENGNYMEWGGTGAVDGKIDKDGNILIGGNVVSNTYNFAADGEASDTYVITLVPVPAAYTTGMMIVFTANTANTGACTINVNALGAKAIKAFHDQDPPDNYIEAGSAVLLCYDGTNMQLLSPDANP